MRVSIIYFVIHVLLVMQEVHYHYFTSPSMSPKWIKTNTTCYVKGSVTFFGNIFCCTLEKGVPINEYSYDAFSRAFTHQIRKNKLGALMNWFI